MAVAGCTTETGPTDALQKAPVSTPTASYPMPVTPARAKALFDAICGASLPNFDTAPQRLRANGFTRPSPQGTAALYSETENVSFQISDGPGMGKTCSMVVASQPSAAALRAAVMGSGAKDTPLGTTALYPNTAALVLEGRTTREGGLIYANYRLLSDRK